MLKINSLTRGTWLQDEELAYPNGGQTRKGKAVCEDGVIRTIYAGIPDTYFTIPAHTRIKNKYVRGYITVEEADTKPYERWYVFKSYIGSR